MDATVRGNKTSVGGPSQVIGPYRLLQKVGEGGMGEVWLAQQDRPVRRRVALKIIRRGMDTERVIARFEAERQALALMDHPTVAKILDAGETPGGRPFFAMEYVEGVPLTEHCDRHRLNTDQRLALFQQICDGVQHAHHNAIIHRDLKPSNILVSYRDGQRVAKIIDFGIAKATAQRLTERSVYTELGQLIGTPEYMSPEQAEMTGEDVDTRTDVYSLGVILYELLVGALPFDAKELRKAGFDEIRRRIREEEPPRPSARVSTLVGEASTNSARNRKTEPVALSRALRGDLDWITMKALEKDRARRYGSPAQLAADVERYRANRPVEAGPPSAVYRAGKFVRRHRFGVATATIALGALIAVAVGMTIQARRLALAQGQAEQVAEFLTELFEVPDPSRSLGREVKARELLDRGARRIADELAGEPELQASLMLTMGRVYNSLGLYEEAQPLARESLRLREERYGWDHPDTLRSASLMAGALQQLGRFEESEQLHRRVLESRRRILGDEHAETLDSLAGLSLLYHDQGRLDETEALASQVYEARRRTLGEGHPDTLGSMSGLANVWLDMGRYDEGERLLRQALDGRREIRGDEHPATLGAMYNLARAYDFQGRFDQSESLNGQVLEISRRVLGEEHPATLTAKSNLGQSIYAQGRFDEAGVLFEEALDGLSRTLGEAHPRTLLVMNNFANVLFSAGKLEEAEALYRRTLAGQEKVVGLDHPDALFTMYNIAGTCSMLGKYDESVLLFRQILETQRRVLGENHPDTLDSINLLAWVQLTREPESERDPAEAQELLLDLIGRTASPKSGWFQNLARSYYQLGDPSKAVEYQKRRLALLPADAPQRAEAEEFLAKFEDSLAGASGR